MSYLHNNLWAMRQNYWQDQHNPKVQQEKVFLLQLLTEQQIYSSPNMDDVQYLFFSLPSLIIVQGYALGFQHPKVVSLIIGHLQRHKPQLQQRITIKASWRMPD